MTYVVLARKWRPTVFEDVVGQEHVTRTLMNALKSERIAHAYIFAGPRGVGKTSTARLLAKAVNCENPQGANPCNQCANCRSITEGHSMDVIEIDGASNRGIDEIRNLRENIRYAPASFRYKIYIIDEVHMLTKEAFNALLKTLEEPPSHAIFIFATTEIHRVPLTILSRCQRFDFKRISIATIKALLHKIVENENITIDEEALFLIARKADGSMRDAESILDQMISFSDGKLSVELVRQSLGLIDQEVYFEFTSLLGEKDSAKILNYAGKIVNSGHDFIDFLHGLQEHFRNLLVGKVAEDPKLLDIPEFYQERYQQGAAAFDEKDIIHYLHIIGEAEQEIKYSAFPQLSLEMLLLKLTHKPASADLEEIIAFIHKLKKNPEIRLNNSGPAGNAPAEKPKPSTEAAPEAGREKSGQYETPGPQGTQIIRNGGDEKEFAALKKTADGFKNLNRPVKKTEKLEAVDTEVDLPRIKQLWPQIVQKVREQKVALGSFLQEGVPFAVREGELILAYDKTADFHKEHVENNKRTVEKLLREEFDISVRIGLQTVDFGREGIEKQPRTPEEVLEDIKNKEPVLRKIIDTFELGDIGKTDV